MLVESVVQKTGSIDPRTISEKEPRLTDMSAKKKEDMEGKPSKSDFQREETDENFLQEVLVAVEKQIQPRGVGLKFAVHTDTGRTKVTVTDRETGDLIREIPPEQVLDLMAKIDEMVGILFDEMV